MELRVLRYFLVVAREENITRAAALLHITQPTLSRQLMQLEQKLGVKLFHRSQYKIVLTDEGMLLRRRAQELVDLADKTEQEFLQKEEELSGEIAIGSGELQAMSYLADILAAFQKIHPHVQFQIYSGNSDNIKERIEKGILDFGLLLEPVDIGKYAFARFPVKEQWGVLVSEEDAYAQKNCISPEDLVGKSLILTRRELVQQAFTRWLGPAAERVRISASGNLPYNMALLAKRNVGIFITLKLDCDYKGLRFLPLCPRLDSESVFVWKKGEAFSPTASAFISFVQKYENHISGNQI